MSGVAEVIELEVVMMIFRTFRSILITVITDFFHPQAPLPPSTLVWMVWMTPNAGNDHDWPESINISCQTTFWLACHMQKYPFFPDRQWNDVVWMACWMTPNAGNDHDWTELFWTSFQTTFIQETCLSDVVFYCFALVRGVDRQTDRQTDGQTFGN